MNTLINRNTNDIPKILKEIEVDEINQFQAASNYTFVLLKNGQKLLSGYSLGVFEKIFSQHVFLRINRTNLVNKDYISSIIERDNSHYVRLQNNQEILIPRRKKNTILRTIPSILKPF
ncbi:LytTR family DNA-binding domain-containing protein [uncultured Arcticibacterium sp.]|uniref:LytR/AlgR family response regulator transcription factor n=1 Tax=uncultured Arcticibacterium sp. TaxID=2173042 RepID=UPI0030F98A92